MHSRSFLKDIVGGGIISALHAEPGFPVAAVAAKTLYFAHSQSPVDNLLHYDVKSLVIHYLDIQVNRPSQLLLSPRYVFLASANSVEILRLKKEGHSFTLTSLFHFPCGPGLMLLPSLAPRFAQPHALLAISSEPDQPPALQTLLLQKEGLSQLPPDPLPLPQG